MLVSVNAMFELTYLAAVAMILAIAPVHADTLVFYASNPGKPTLDQGEGGGNPFASALIEAIESPLILSDLPAVLRRLTSQKSCGFQAADVPTSIPQDFSLVPARPDESRIALVMVVSDYAGSEGLQSLPGASHDAERIAVAFKRIGFQTEQAIDLDLRAMRKKLSEYRARYLRAYVAVVYTTGHGVEVQGTVFLLPGNYPMAEGNAALTRRALALPEVTRSLGAKRVSLVFYGGCRDNPIEHPEHVGDTGGDQGLVAVEPEGEAKQDRH